MKKKNLRDDILLVISLTILAILFAASFVYFILTIILFFFG